MSSASDSGVRNVLSVQGKQEKRSQVKTYDNRDRRTFMTVAPSFVMVCLPLPSTSNKSPPYGPRVLLIVD